MEICSTLQQGSWGYKKGCRWLTANQAMQKFDTASKAGANLLLNVGPKADGSIPTCASEVLREMGNRISPHKIN